MAPQTQCEGGTAEDAGDRIAVKNTFQLGNTSLLAPHFSYRAAFTAICLAQHVKFEINWLYL